MSSAADGAALRLGAPVLPSALPGPTPFPASSGCGARRGLLLTSSTHQMNSLLAKGVRPRSGRQLRAHPRHVAAVEIEGQAAVAVDVDRHRAAGDPARHRHALGCRPGRSRVAQGRFLAAPHASLVARAASQTRGAVLRRRAWCSRVITAAHCGGRCCGRGSADRVEG